MKSNSQKRAAAENERLRKLAEDWLAPCKKLGVMPDAEMLTSLLMTVSLQAQMDTLTRVRNEMFSVTFAPQKQLSTRGTI